MADVKPLIEITIDYGAKTYEVHDVLAESLAGTPTAEDPRPLPAGGMPWHLEIAQDPKDSSKIAVSVVDQREPAFDPAHATACSVIAVDAWITDKVFEVHDDTIYVVRVVNTSSHYVAEDICVDLALDPSCAGALELLPDQHSLIEIQPTHQCIKCLSPRHYVDLRFVAIARGPRPGVFPVRACVTYDLVYWTRARARTHARLELEVQDDCRPRRDPCRPARSTPSDAGDYQRAPEPVCPLELFGPCWHGEPEYEDCDDEDCDDDTDCDDTTGCDECDETGPDECEATDCVEPADGCGCEADEPAPEGDGHVPTEVDDAGPGPATASDERDEPADLQDYDESVDGRPGGDEPHDADEVRGDQTMGNEKYAKHDHHDHHHHDHHHHGPPGPKKDDDGPSEKKGCAPACSNADEMMAIVDVCRLPEGGNLEFSYTFRKGFIAHSGKGGRCVYGRSAANGKVECRLESIDETVLVLDVSNHSHFHLKHVRIHGIRIFQNHEEVRTLLPSGHPVAQIIPDAVYIGSLPRGESKWAALSFITRGVAAGCYAVKFCVDYDIEACTVSAGINVEIVCD